MNEITTKLNPAAKSIRVLLADDHTLVRAGLRALLEKLPAVAVAGEASDGREVIDLIKAHQPDVVLMDISMPGLNGLQALARITRDYPKVRVIILSMHHNDEYVMQALKSGASGYLLKRAATAELAAALKSVVDGEIYLSREISCQFLQKFHLDILNFQESLPLARQKMINFPVEPVNFEFRMDAYLVITFIMETVSHLLTVLAHDNDGSLNRSKDRKDKIEEDIGIRVEWPGQ